MCQHESELPAAAGEVVPAVRYIGLELEPEALRSSRSSWSIRLLVSTTLENQAMATPENEATQTDWMGDLSGRLGFESTAGRGIALTGEGGLLTTLTRQVLQRHWRPRWPSTWAITSTIRWAVMVATRATGRVRRTVRRGG
jgi:hypothetical protein